MVQVQKREVVVVSLQANVFLSLKEHESAFESLWKASRHRRSQSES